jgi:hypothetical protein
MKEGKKISTSGERKIEKRNKSHKHNKQGKKAENKNWVAIKIQK